MSGRILIGKPPVSHVVKYSDWRHLCVVGRVKPDGHIPLKIRLLCESSTQRCCLVLHLCSLVVILRLQVSDLLSVFAIVKVLKGMRGV